MAKSRVPICFIALMSIIIVCFLLFFVPWYLNNYRELRQEEIRPMLKRISGRELPSKTEGLRAIVHNYNGAKILYVAFQTDREGQLFILDAFGGRDAKTVEFPPKESHQWAELNMTGFRGGYFLQKKLDVVLFDMDLIDRIWRDRLEEAKTGHYPKDAITGTYLKSDASSSKGAFAVSYGILLFDDKGVVYICAGKVRRGTHVR